MAQAYVVFVLYSAAPLAGEWSVEPVDDPFVTPAPVATAGALFEVEDWSMDVEQTLTIGSRSTGAGAGRVTFNPFSITGKVDQASPHLFLAACSGPAFEFVDLLQLRPGDPGRRVYLAWRFGLVAVNAAQSPDGTIGPMVFSGWNRVRNVAVT